MFLIDTYIKNRTEDLSFIHLREDADLKLKGYHLPPGGLDVPLLTEELANNIKTKKESEVITLGAVMRGMLYTLGIDSNFIHREEYIQFLKVADNNIQAFILKEGIQAGDQQRLLESIIFLKSALVISPDEPQAMLHYAVTLLKYCVENLKKTQKEFKVFRQEAKNILERLLDIQPDPLAYYHLAYIYKEEKQFLKSQLYGQKLMEQEVDELMKLQVTHLLHELEDLVAYEKGYQAVLALRPEEGLEHLLPLEEKYNEWWNLLFFIGLALRQTGNFVESITYFQKVLEIKSDQVDTLVELGLCYGSLGDYQEAIEYSSQALELAGENGEILCNLAVIYMEIGDFSEAEMYLRRSLALNPTDEITLACMERLNSVSKS